MTEAAATVLITRARLWTDGARAPGESAIALAGDRVLACGPTAELEAGTPADVPRIDAHGATVTPGLWDAHIHLLPWARARAELDLEGTPDAAAAAARLAEHLARHPGEGPVVGRGWDANDWREAPHRGALDRVAPSRPVLLHSRDFHALWANGAALRAAGISRGTVAPSGGVIERDAAGEPTGVVRENAVRAFRELERQAAEASGDPQDLLAEAAEALHALGITGVHDFERGEAAFHTMERFARGTDTARARVRVVQCVDPDDLARVAALGLKSGDGDDRFRVGGVKLFADGTLGSRTAAMLEPYEGSAERGLEVLKPADLDERLASARAAGFAVAIHAIGDRACRNALDAFDRWRTRMSGAPPPAIADRIEHIQLLSPDDLGRFGALRHRRQHAAAPLHQRRAAGAAALGWPLPQFLSVARPARFRRGAHVRLRRPGRAAFGLIGARGGLLPGDRGGGFVRARPVRHARRGAAGLHRDQRANRGCVAELGSLRPGSRADLVIWDRDLHATPAGRLHEARPSCTLADGIVVHPRGDAGARRTDPRP